MGVFVGKRIYLPGGQIERIQYGSVKLGAGIVGYHSEYSIAEGRQCSSGFGQDVDAAFGAADNNHGPDVLWLVFAVEFHLNMQVSNKDERPGAEIIIFDSGRIMFFEFLD